MTTERTLVLPAPPRARLWGLLIVVASLVYLLAFVGRGWIPHDEGMIGQSAERVLNGGIPHVDYQEPYTGALTWLYAGLFRLTGVDLLNVRWLLFAGASLALWTAYAILRRWLEPVGAALATIVALVWSFPNYFAGLPSWWILICALLFMWALIRHIESGRRRYAAVAGLAVGTAIVIKQTGVYLLIPLLMCLAYPHATSTGISTDTRLTRLFRVVVALTTVVVAVAVLRPRLRAAEFVYLLLPIAASSLGLLLSPARTASSSNASSAFITMTLALGSAALPLAVFTAGYAIHGQLTAFIEGIVLLPQKRLAFAFLAMPPVSLILTGLVPPLVFSVKEPRESRRRIWETGRWMVAVGVALLSLTSVIAYQFVWQSSRAVAALVPLVICWIILTRRSDDDRRDQVLILCSSTLAWASLVQFPYSGPIYFCYVAPLAVIAAAGTARYVPHIGSRMLVPWGVLLFCFAVLSLNRGYINNLGRWHLPQDLGAPLDLPKAHLTVSAADAHAYQEVVRLVARHLKGGALIAEPDSPELYFLADRFSPGGTLFDFFSQDQLPKNEAAVYADIPSDVTVWVLNHDPSFSPPPSAARTSEVRRSFPHGQRVAHFEVRWR